MGAQQFTGTERYAVDTTIGQGAFGVVYRVFDHVRQEPVALKLLSNLAGDRLLAFKREFRALADVAHPNVVSLYELISTRDEWFFTMELVEGVHFLDHVSPLSVDARQRAMATTLDTATGPASEIRRPPPSSHSFDASNLQSGFAQLVDGTRALHRSGQLHRDLKPSNAMVSSSGRVVLLDFGLVTEVGTTVVPLGRGVEGTVPYMSPEQCAGGRLTPASDFYSIGVMLYEALTGTWPFEGTAREVMVAKQRLEPPSPQSVVADVPPELDELCRRLLAVDPEQRPDADEILHTLGVPPVPASSRRPGQRGLPLVGRDDELEVLERLFAETVTGKPQAVLVRGPSGVGKSALVDRFTETLDMQRRAVVLRGACYQRESVPYKALDSFMDALSSMLERLPRREAERLLPMGASALARLFPVLGTIASAAPPAGQPALDVDTLRRRAIDALRDLMTRLRDKRPLVLCIDDVQWGDGDSARLLDELLSPGCPPILFVFCFRSEEEDEEFVRLLMRSLDGQPAITTSSIELGPLGAASARAMTESLLGAASLEARPELVADIVREAEGSPFFIRELVTYLVEAGEPAGSVVSLPDLLPQRIAALEGSARLLLECVAVAGRPLPERLASRAVELDGNLSPLRTLRAAHLVRRSWDGSRADIDTYHGRIREAVVEGLSPERRRELHGALAQAYIDDGESDVEAIGGHLRHAGDTERAGRYTRRAAERAFDTLAFERAASLYQLVLAGEVAPSERSDLTERLALALAQAGRGPESARAYLRATEGADKRRRVTLRCRAAEQLCFSGHLDEADELFRSVLRAMDLPPMPTTDLGALAAFGRRRAQLAWRGLGYRVRDAASLEPEALDRVDISYSVSAVLAGVRPFAASGLQTHHLQLALELGEPYRVIRGLSLEAIFSSMPGPTRASKSRALLAEAHQLAGRYPSANADGVLGLAEGICAFFQGRWSRACKRLAQTEELIVERCPEMTFELRQVQSFLGLASFYLGDFGRAGPRAEALLRDLRARGDRYAESMLANVSYRHLLFRDQVDAARLEVARALSGWFRGGQAVQDYYEKLALARIAIYTGDGRGAHDLIDRSASSILRSANGQVQLIRVETQQLRVQAALLYASQLGEGRRRRSLLREGERQVRRLDRERSAVAAAWCLLLRAGLVQLQGEREHARLLLLDAEHACRREGMEGHARAAAWQRGELAQATAEDVAAKRDAEAWMTRAGIVRPARFAHLMVPGFTRGR